MNIYMTPERVGGFKFSREELLWERRWQGDGHLEKEVLKARGTIGRRRTGHIRKERAPRGHSKGRPTLGVPKPRMCRWTREASPYSATPLGCFLPRTLGGLDLSLKLCTKLLNQNASAVKSVRPSAK